MGAWGFHFRDPGNQKSILKPSLIWRSCVFRIWEDVTAIWWAKEDPQTSILVSILALKKRCQKYGFRRIPADPAEVAVGPQNTVF